MPKSSTLNRRDFMSVFYKTIDDLDGLRVSPDLQMKVESKRKILNVICTLQMLHDLLNLNDIDNVTKAIHPIDCIHIDGIQNNADTNDSDDTDDTDNTVDTDSIDSNVFLEDCGCCKT